MVNPVRTSGRIDASRSDPVVVGDQQYDLPRWLIGEGSGPYIVSDHFAAGMYLTIPILLGIEALKRKGGRIVVQGEMPEFPNFPIGKMTTKFVTMHSARGHSYLACELALQQLASQRFPLELVTTHKFGLNDVDLAIRSVGNKEGAVKDVIHASLMPWL
jgi:threonine dehydrogenase-like Zn-dependent dehydrogenase